MNGNLKIKQFLESIYIINKVHIFGKKFDFRQNFQDNLALKIFY